jgi:ABC-type amino acid transport substrate-binding protein
MKHGSFALTWLAAAALLLLPVGRPAHAEDTLAKIKASKHIVMATYNEPPHNWVEPSGGGYKGIDFDLASTILRGQGVTTIDEIPVDWAGLIPGLIAGRWDMVAVGAAITAERAKQVAFTDPIYSYGLALIVPKGNPKGIKGRKELEGLRIGGILGSTTDTYVKKIPGATFVPFKTHPEMLADLEAGRIDAILAGETTAAYAQSVHPEPVDFVHNWEGYKDELYKIAFYFRKEDKAMLDTFNAALAKMKADGSAAKILETYGLTKDNLIE